MKKAGFSRPNRLTGRNTVSRIFREGKSVRGGWINLIAVPNGLLHNRFGCSVKRQAAPGGVLRNRIKRWLRESFRLNRALFPAGVDLFVVVVQKPAKLSFMEVERSIVQLSLRLRRSSESFKPGSGGTGESSTAV